MMNFGKILALTLLSSGLTACVGNQAFVATPANYQQNTSIQLPIEKRYMQNGSFAVSSQTFASGQKEYSTYKIWYPTDIAKSGKKYPLVIMANGTGITFDKYEPVFEHLASWGFIVVGNNDKSAMFGKSTSKTLDFALALNQDRNSPFFNKINSQQIGVAGHSQGGMGVVSGAIYYPNSHLFKAVFAASAGHDEVAKLKVPYFLMTGTTGAEKFLANPEKTLAQFNGLNNNGLSVLARRKDTGHGEMLYMGNGYMVAWFRYLLQQDSQAVQAFIGNNAEIARNPLWQDVKIKH